MNLLASMSDKESIFLSNKSLETLIKNTNTYIDTVGGASQYSGQLAELKDLQDDLFGGDTKLSSPEEYDNNEAKLKEYHFDTRVTYNKEIYTREQVMNLFGNLVRR